MKKSCLTVDELIIEYMIYRIRKDYEPRFTVTEFMKFLDFFKTKLDIGYIPEDGLKIFKNFFEKKNKFMNMVGFVDYIDYTSEISIEDKKKNPRMTMEYSKEENDYIIKAGNCLCYHHGSHNMDWEKEPVESIKEVMDEYLINEKKRTIDENIEVSEGKLQVGKQIAARMFYEIWKSHIKYEIDCDSWPRQCTDINKYLFEMDLAPIIGLDSIKKELLELYSVLSKRIAILYSENEKFKINSDDNAVVSSQNYRLLIKGYERLVGFAYGEYKKDLEIDFSKLEITEAYEYGTSYWDCGADVKIDTTKIENEASKKLVLSIDNEINN